MRSSSLLDARRLRLLASRVWGVLAPCTCLAAGDDYRAEIEGFRQRREADLRAEDGWLCVVGLHWLHQGESRLGSASACRSRR